MAAKSGDYEIVYANSEQVALILDWAAAEGWNPGLHDARCFYATDQQGFFLLQIDAQPVASLSAVKYGDAFGFIGLYLVRPEFRHQGYGYALWQYVLARTQVASLGLDGVVAQQDNYKKSGFQLLHRNCRYSGRVAQLPGLPHPYLISTPTAQDWPELIAFDTQHFGFAREQFLRAWLAQPSSKAVLLRLDGVIAGFGVIRACQQAYKIGPLFAKHAGLALAIIQQLCAELSPDSEFVIDVPEPNHAALTLVTELGLQAVFETARMYRGAVPELPLQHIFGITSFELG